MVKKGLAIVLAGTLLVTAGCGPKPDAAEQAAPKPKVVQVYTVHKQTAPILLTATGVVEAKQDMVLSFGTQGRISQIAVQKGANVQKGQLLAALDGSYFNQEVAAAAGRVKETAARKTQTLKGASQEKIDQQRLRVQEKERDLKQAQDELARSEKLYAGGAISQKELDDRKRAVEQAQTALKNEQISLQELVKGADAEDIAVFDAQLQQASGDVARAKKTLQDARIVAPFAGTIVDVTQGVGELSGPGNNLIHLVDLSEVKVTIDVTNDLVSQYRVGEQVTAKSDSGAKSTGTITFVSPVIDEKTGKYRVEVTVPNPDRTWRGGMIATVEKPRKLNGFVVPLESVGISKQDRYVMAVENGVVKKRIVQVGQVMDDQIEILSGVKPNDQLIVTGITYFVDGEKVVTKGE